MAVTIEKLDACMTEIRRFILKSSEARGKVKKERWTPCKETAAVKRASMDLTRALAELRKS